MLDLTLDPATETRLVSRFGPGFHDWFAALPALLERLARRWDLEIVAAVTAGNTSRTFHVRRAGGVPAFLKLTPEPEIGITEASALRAWEDSPHVVRLIDSDDTSGSLLLAAVEPGTRVDRLPIEDVALLLRSLRLADVPDVELPTLRQRVDFIFDLTLGRWRGNPAERHLDRDLLDRHRAAALALASGGPAGLVHGDLHPGNVLVSHGHGFVVIDPRPSVGDPTFDGVDWVLDHVTELHDLEENIARLAALNPEVNADRLMGWCRATAALIAVPRLNRGPLDRETRFLLRLAGGEG
ncbi:streptomycin 6-kinase [Streptosporangium lutulentum]|uniref:Streptomycin 6-kinase n=2 Tax=Streptosporangium lutulentum TaxID=1461250 RepID=A0ABT9Q948_9ACTN|nr:aminoglycoside phosphotransferase family protein [Streptosporangium lutulentum]MDP9842599.1 streptomycin 6-kinase [Streptosporangium lutulentum]